jgi:hypothetical protein
MLTGLLPHRNRSGILAGDAYRDDLLQWACRLGDGGSRMRFERFVPHLSLPRMLGELGYHCEAFVSLPVLNPQTIVAQHFNRYTLMPSHNDLGAIIDQFCFDGNTPRFYFVNTGETHYPYLIAGESDTALPRLPGVHGTFRALDDLVANPTRPANPRGEAAFTPEQLSALHQKQVRCLEHLDRVVGRLLAAVPPNTYFILTADHGELFGEDGHFGHGPMCHEKVFEVFLVEGLRPHVRPVQDEIRSDAQGIAPPTVVRPDISPAAERIVIDRLRALGYL